MADLVGINRRLGGHSTIRRLFAETISGEERFSILDVGAASGDTARLVQGVYPGATVTSLDAIATHLREAPQPKLVADAFRLPFGKGAFDIVFSSLFLHHFREEAVVELLREFGRVARRYVLVCDLERHILPYLFLPVAKWWFGWHPMTVHDGTTSVRAAFRRAELERLAHEAGLRAVTVRVWRPAFRLAMKASK